VHELQGCSGLFGRSGEGEHASLGTDTGAQPCTTLASATHALGIVVVAHSS